jgi:hypothetical protein
MTQLPRAAPAARPNGRAGTGAGDTPPQRSIYDELTAAVPAVEPESAHPTTAFVSAHQREEMALAARRTRRRNLLRVVLPLLAGVVALHFLIIYTVLRAPSAGKLAALAERTAADVLRLYSNPEQPFELSESHAQVQAHLDAATVRSVVTVTLRLREPLYEPADSNGTEVYRSYAAAIAHLEAESARRGLASDGAAHVPPVLPKILRRTHGAGETLVVSAPALAHRFGWSWNLGTAELEQRRTDRTFAGKILALQGHGPVLLLDSPDTLTRIRELNRLAKEYLEHVGRDLDVLPAPSPARTP